MIIVNNNKVKKRRFLSYCIQSVKYCNLFLLRVKIRPGLIKLRVRNKPILFFNEGGGGEGDRLPRNIF